MDIIQELILKEGNFPGNPTYPLLIYKQAFSDIYTPEVIQTRLQHNHWINPWVDGIFDFHHYHSNTHEVLVVIAGDCQVQFGGEHGKVYRVNQGDVIIIPAGIAHKSIEKSQDFKCIGAYPLDIKYDMNYGNSKENYEAAEAIKKVGLPDKDPVFGEAGLLFKYWK